MEIKTQFDVGDNVLTLCANGVVRGKVIAVNVASITDKPAISYSISLDNYSNSTITSPERCVFSQLGQLLNAIESGALDVKPS